MATRKANLASAARGAKAALTARFGVDGKGVASAKGPIGFDPIFADLKAEVKGLPLVPLQAFAVLIIDEAQNLSTEVLENIRLLSNFETSRAKLMHIILSGQPELADKLANIVPRPLSKSLLLSTGSESNEAAIKMAKLYTGGFEMIGLGGSWHGVTGNAGAVSYASDRKGYGPAMPGSFVIPEPNAYRCPVKHCRDHCDRTCMQIGFEMYDMQSAGAPAAIIAEPVISAGGVIVPPAGYFDALQAEVDSLRGLQAETAAELDALLPEPPELREAEDLEAAGVGQDRPVPGHEAMEPAHLAHQLMAGAQEEMVGVGQHDLGARGEEVRGGQALDRALGRHRHEGRRVDRPVRGELIRPGEAGIDGIDQDAWQQEGGQALIHLQGFPR